MKESGRGGEFKYDIFEYCKDFCKFHNTPLPSTSVKKKVNILNKE
jgi:hypothetical protein